MALPVKQDIQALEIKLLFEAIYQQYGFDFRNYSKKSATRRVLKRLQQEKIESVSILQHRVLRDQVLADSLFRDLSINVTEMFRNPKFYKAIRKKILKKLDNHQHLKIWHAGCATGEEVYSMAILLKEEGRYKTSQLYATDFNPIALEAAKQGIYPINRMQLYTSNYIASGCKKEFSDYYHAKYERALIDEKLKENLIFAQHNLATDASFGEMQIIICRNVLIYFDRELQDRVFHLFNDSLSIGGYLCLGSHETLRLSSVYEQFEVIDEKHRIYQKIK